nr:hypothetical protein [Candidatus Freyarchaeota archaeon]
MSKKGSYKRDLVNLFDEFLKTEDEGKIFEFIILNSNLPGPRGNLELAAEFAELVEEYFVKDSERLWNLCLKLMRFSSDEAPVNNPKEFLAFCGAFAIGAIGSVSSDFFEDALFRLRELSNDPRWRVREGVAMGLQKLIERQSQKTLKELDGWIAKDNWLTMRAVVAGVAEPALLRNEQNARWALELHKKIFAQVLATKDRKSEGFKKLKHALGYSISVVIYAIPKEGFGYVYQLIDSQDSDILWIINSTMLNLRLFPPFSALGF